MRSSSLHHNPLTVWRVENAAGEGPYDSGASSGVGPRGSAPVVDFGVRHEDKDAWWVRHEGWRFGFAHKEDAVAWFGEARLKKLAEKGYRLVKKEAAIIEPSKSGMQVFYLPVEKKLSGKEQVLALGRQVEAGATVEGWDQMAQRSMSMWAMASVCRDDPSSWPYDKGLLARYLRELKQYQQPGESARDAWDRYAKQVKFRKQRRNPRLYEYQGEHLPPGPDDGAPMHDVDNMMPDYCAHPEWYATGAEGRHDFEAASIICAVRGRPWATVWVYRAVPPGVKEINPGDWVTQVRSYAVEHLESNLGGVGRILKRAVRAGSLFTEGNSHFEWGWWPDEEREREFLRMLRERRAAQAR